MLLTCLEFPVAFRLDYFFRYLLKGRGDSNGIHSSHQNIFLILLTMISSEPVKPKSYLVNAIAFCTASVGDFKSPPMMDVTSVGVL